MVNVAGAIGLGLAAAFGLVKCNGVSGGEQITCGEEVSIADRRFVQAFNLGLMRFQNGEVAVEARLLIPGEGLASVAALRNPAYTLEGLFGINGGRLVTDSEGKIKIDADGAIIVDTEAGTPCTTALTSCAPYAGLPKIVPAGFVRVTPDNKLLLKRADSSGFVAVGRMRDAFWSDPVFRFTDREGRERFVVRKTVNDPTFSCSQTFYLEVSRDGKVINIAGNEVENASDAESLLPRLQFNETTGGCDVSGEGNLVDLTLEAMLVGTDALRIAQSYYRYNQADNTYLDTEGGNPIPIPAANRPWEGDYLMLVDPTRRLSDIGDLAALRALAVSTGEVEVVVEDASGRYLDRGIGGWDGRQTATTSMLDMEQENPGPGVTIDERFYRANGQYAVVVRVRTKLNKNLDELLENPEIQNELVYFAVVEGRLRVVCGEEVERDAETDTVRDVIEEASDAGVEADVPEVEVIEDAIEEG
jgi:hypothetical protein